MVTAGLLDDRYTTGSAGYDFSIKISANFLDYTGHAIAQGPNAGRYDYYTKPDYTIRYSLDPTRSPTGLTGEPVR